MKELEDTAKSDKDARSALEAQLKEQEAERKAKDQAAEEGEKLAGKMEIEKLEALESENKELEKRLSAK